VLRGGTPLYRAFIDDAGARQSLNAGSWKIFKRQATAAYLLEAPHERGAVVAVATVRRGGGTPIARNNDDGLPPRAF
jgi:hypothetical protein